MKKIINILLITFSLFWINNVDALSIGRVTNETGVIIRKGPGTNYELQKKIYYNDNLTINSTVIMPSEKGCSSGWYNVNYNGIHGYACSSYISTSSHTVRVDTLNRLKVRSGPGTDYSIYKYVDDNFLLTLAYTSKFEGKSCSSGWYRLNFDTYKDKYICSSYTDYYNSKSNVIVTNENGTNLKSATFSNTSINLKYNQGLTLYNKTLYSGKNCSSKYYKVYYQGKIYYICSDDVLNTTVNATINNYNGINIRKGPGTNYSVADKLTYNTDISLVSTEKYSGSGCSSDWYKFKLNGNYYYVCSIFTTTTNKTAITTESTIIREKANNDSYAIKTINKNTTLLLASTYKYSGSGCPSGWYKIYFNGEENYVCSKYTNLYVEDTEDHENLKPVVKIENSSNGEWTNNRIDLIITATDENGIKNIKYSYDNENWYTKSEYDSDSTDNKKIWKPYYASDQNRTLYIKATDSTGNESDIVTTNIKIDKTSPIVEIENSSNGEWTGNRVNITITAKDTSSGTKNIKYSYDNENWYTKSEYDSESTDTEKIWKPYYTSNQNRTLYIKAIDNAGNESDIEKTYIKIDKDAQTIIKNDTKYGNYYTINSWTYRVNEDYAYIRSSASTSSSIMDTVYLGTELKYLGSEDAGNGCSSGWYKVSYFNNKTGYICKTYVDKYNDITKTNSTYCNTLKSKGFPESYCPYLSYLHSKYPNWVFKAEKTGISFLSAINGESGKNYTQIAKSPYITSWTIAEKGGWRIASDAYVAFMLDPRNYLNEKNIFAFEDLSYDEDNHTVDAVRSVFDGTYLDTNTYANYFVTAGSTYDVSPIHLAARAKQEGSSNSSYDAISGKVSTKWNDKTGYVCSGYTEIVSKKTVSSNNAGTNIRSGPGTDYKVTAITNNTSEKYILETTTKYSGKGCEAGWYKLNFNGDTSYICSSFVKVNTQTDEKGYVSNSNGVNIRDDYTTDSNIIMKAKDKSTFTLLSSKKYNGSGCPSGWYKVKLDGYSLANIYNYYNIGSYGDNPVLRGLAVAAGYIDDEYGTPWNTREKAIKYGARWIAKGYINEGQNTLYYQKFNTSPNATANTFTHQYQTNILAPAGEGLSIYRTYKESGTLSQSIVFNIPVYTSMPIYSTTHPPIN